VGQRRRLGFAAGRRLHVIDIDQATGTVTVGEKPDLAATALTVKEPNLFVEALPARALVQIRYQHEAAPAALAPCEDGIRVGFDEPQFAVTPGQSAVFYDAEGRVLGGGYIEREGKLTGPTGFSASR